MSRDNTVITNNENKSNNFENKSNKQIEEMAKDLDACPFIQAPIGCDQHEGSIAIAEYLYNADYRKIGGLAEEIFAEIEQVMISLDRRYMASGNPKQSWGVRGAMTEIAELKKKYIGEDTNVRTKESEKDNG